MNSINSYFFQIFEKKVLLYCSKPTQERNADVATGADSSLSQCLHCLTLMG